MGVNATLVETRFCTATREVKRRIRLPSYVCVANLEPPACAPPFSDDVAAGSAGGKRVDGRHAVPTATGGGGEAREPRVSDNARRQSVSRPRGSIVSQFNCGEASRRMSCSDRIFVTRSNSGLGSNNAVGSRIPNLIV